MKTIQVRWTRHAGYCWRSKDEFISDIHLWTHHMDEQRQDDQLEVYIQQLCANTGCSLEDLSGAMDDKDGWQERVREIHAGSATWWWYQTFLSNKIVCTVVWFQVFLSNTNYHMVLNNDFFLISHIGMMVTVLANGPGDLGSIPGRIIPKTQIMVLDATLLNTQHYKVKTKGKIEQSRGKSSAFFYTLVW